SQIDRLSDATNRYSRLVRDNIETNINAFSSPHMGSTLFVYGLVVLAIACFLRLAQWVLVSFGRSLSFLGQPQGLEMDDLFFLGLLFVSVTMMAGGLLANLYLIWSIQRAELQAAESVRTTALMDQLNPVKPIPPRLGAGVGRNTIIETGSRKADEIKT